jgi:hypothetical protein
MSLDAILLANPALRPELLQIGQQVIIPPPNEENRAAGYLPLTTPVPLTIRNTAWYTTPTGGVWFVGEVANNTATPVENVRLGVTVYGTGNTILAEQDGWAAADLVDVGTAAPFGLLFGPLPGAITTYETILMSSEVVTREGLWHPDLTITEAGSGVEASVYRVKAAVRNGGTVEALDVAVVVTLYDRDGRVTGFAQERLGTPIAPASVTELELLLAPVAPGTEQVALAVSGRLPQDDE